MKQRVDRAKMDERRRAAFEHCAQDAAWRDIMTAWWNVPWYDPMTTILYSTLLYSTLLYSTLLHYTILYYTILYYTNYTINIISYNMILSLVSRIRPTVLCHICFWAPQLATARGLRVRSAPRLITIYNNNNDHNVN